MWTKENQAEAKRFVFKRTTRKGVCEGKAIRLVLDVLKYCPGNQSFVFTCRALSCAR